MKNFVKNFLLVLVAVGLVISFVGCAAMQENVEEHKATKDNKWEHTWVAEYENDQYIRSALQFGTGNDKVDEVDVNVKMEYPQNGKAGFIFGLKTNKEKDENGDTVRKYNYFLVGVGERRGSNGTLQWYIDRCDNMTSLSGGNTASETVDTSTGATTEEILKLTDLNVSHEANAPIEFDINVVFTEDKNDKDGKGTYSVELSFAGNVVDSYEITDLYEPGTIASYGMLSGEAQLPKSVDTTWLVNQKTIKGTLSLSAVEE